MKQDKISPNGASGVHVSAARDQARRLLEQFVGDVRTLDQFLKSSHVDEIRSGSSEDRIANDLYRWFGSYNQEARDLLVQKATRMNEMIGGTTGWKFFAYPEVKGRSGRNAETNFKATEYRTDKGIIASPSKSVNLFKGWFAKERPARANIIIHESVHATNGPGVGSPGKQGHFIRASGERQFLEFDISGGWMSVENAIKNADSWECYFGNGVC